MCQINDVQIAGSQPWSAAGNPSSITVNARATGCDYLRVDVYRDQSDASPMYSATDRPVSAGGIAYAQFTVTSDKNVLCGDVLWVEVSCQTDPTCFWRGDVRVVCKGLEGADTCPTMGPPLSVEPPVDTNADCVAGGNYAITIGGSWPSGTTFNWSLSQNGQFTPTNEHGISFTLQHPVGTAATTVLAQIEVPGCDDVFTSVTIPEADAGNCPVQIDIIVIGPAGPLPISADGTYTGLAPGNYQIVVTAPTGNDVQFEWYRDNVQQPSSIGSPEALAVAGLAVGDSTTIAVRVQRECCAALLDTVVLQTRPGRGDPNDPNDPGGGGDPNDPNLPPNPPVINWPCLILGVLVAIALVVALVSIVVTATGPLAILVFPVLVAAAIAVIITAILLLLICRPSVCRILRILAWSLKWAIVIGAIIAISMFSLTAILVVIVYGMIIAAIEWGIARNGCQDPPMPSLP
jgi:hypothetical protein